MQRGRFNSCFTTSAETLGTLSFQMEGFAMFCAMTTNTSAESALQNISAHPFSHNDYTLLAFNAALCLPNNQRHVELNDCFRLQMHGQSIQCMVFFTARGSNNNSMEPSRHLKTFCLGENCFRPSRSDLSSARLINQFQFLPFRSFEKTC